MEKGPSAAMTIAFSHVVHQVLVISLALSPLFHIHSSGELHGKAGSGHVVIMISVTFA